MSARPLFDHRIAAGPAFNRVRQPVTDEMLAGPDGGPIIEMHYNESLVGPSPAVIEVVQKQAHLLFKYPPGPAELDLRDLLAAMHGRGLTAENLVCGNGGSEVIQFVADGFLAADDEVILCPPTFGAMNLACQRIGARAVMVDLLPDSYAIDLDGVLAAVTDRTRILYLCNPNNPTGNIIPNADMERLMANLPESVLVIADEVYNPFNTDPDYPDTTPYIHQGRNLIQIYSFSKVFGLAGLRLGYGIARPEIANYLARLMRYFHIGRLALFAGIAAVQDQAHMRHTITTVISGREWLASQLPELGVRVWPSQGNFLLMNSGESGLSSGELTLALLKHGLLVGDAGPRFKLNDCIRVTVGLPEHNQRFLDAMTRILAGL